MQDRKIEEGAGTGDAAARVNANCKSNEAVESASTEESSVNWNAHSATLPTCRRLSVVLSFTVAIPRAVKTSPIRFIVNIEFTLTESIGFSRLPKQDFIIQKINVVHAMPLDATLMDDRLALRDCYSFGFRSVPLTDAHLKRLVTRNVDKLTLMKTNVTDTAGLRHLISMKRLLDRSLTGPFSNDRLRQIVQLTELTKLKIRESKLTNDNLKQLADLKNLRELNLDGSQAISDAGLSKLNSLKPLKILSLHQCKVSDAGVEALQDRIPGCKVRR